ncbi:chromosome partitioning protein [Saccharothrix sp. S26]|uniref:MinD/ParA family ATP-binding protein n=1 Tax=Saccharothrix sp. S26 TaxID=2907215 RepID=UPI001F29B0F0|nr:chromosome partitioning protein [Saccharothrix sp. S26]MCE6996884.1 chromosome partitioning protein [Saccharothrix sp. S26]
MTAQAMPHPPRTGAPPLVRRVPHGDSAVRRALRTVGRAITDGRATRELADLARRAAMPLPTSRRVAVVSVHGGAGRTATAALLASIYAARRRQPVLAADAEPFGGALSWRLGLTAPPPLASIAPALLTARSGTLEDIAHLLPRLPNGLWVLPGGAPGTPRLCREVTTALSRLFAVIVTDCPGGLSSPNTTEVLADAHSVVIACAATPDAVRSTYDAVARIAATRGPTGMGRAVVALNVVNPAGLAALRADTTKNAFAGLGVPVVTVPHDRHLAAGVPLVPSKVGEAALVEATRLAGEALVRAAPM